jgi:hypothetical protein
MRIRTRKREGSSSCSIVVASNKPKPLKPAFAKKRSGYVKRQNCFRPALNARNSSAKRDGPKPPLASVSGSTHPDCSLRNRKLNVVSYSVTKPTTIFFFDAHNEAEVLEQAKEIADRTGREIEVRNSNGDLIGTVFPTKH